MRLASTAEAAPAQAPEGDVIAPESDSRLKKFLRSAIEHDIVHMLGHLTRPGDRVLEVTATLRSYAGRLAGIRPETIHVEAGDWKSEMAALKAKVASLKGSRFDVVFLQGIVSYAADIQEVLELLRPVCHADTRLVLLMPWRNTTSK